MKKDKELVLKILEDQQQRNLWHRPDVVMIGFVSDPHDGMFQPGYSFAEDPLFEFDMSKADEPQDGAQYECAETRVPEICLNLVGYAETVKRVMSAKDLVLIDYMRDSRPVVAIRD